jgi:hypothetical protein
MDYHRLVCCDDHEYWLATTTVPFCPKPAKIIEPPVIMKEVFLIKHLYWFVICKTVPRLCKGANWSSNKKDTAEINAQAFLESSYMVLNSTYHSAWSTNELRVAPSYIDMRDIKNACKNMHRWEGKLSHSYAKRPFLHLRIDDAASNWTWVMYVTTLLVGTTLTSTKTKHI